MYIKKIELTDFRNYDSLSLDFDKNVNLILGKNAQGKTNLLESVYVTAIGKSFRTNKDSDLIKFGKDFAKVCAYTYKDETDGNVEIIYHKDSKKYAKVDGVKIKKTSELLKNVYIVIFSPEDLKIVKDEPEKRRRFIDRELCQIRPAYYESLLNYKKILTQRNAYLKEITFDKSILDIWDMQLSACGALIMHHRDKFIKKISEIGGRIHSGITNGNENMIIRYAPNLKFDENLKNQEEKFIEESKFDIKNLPNVNCVKIQLVDIAPQNADSDDEEAYIAANTFSVFLNARIGESAEITNGQKDAWQPLYYLNLGHETRYAYGEAVGILTKTGKVSGYIWEDTNKNGIMDDSEAIAPSYTGWTVEAYMPGTTLSGAPIRKSTISDEGKYEIHDLSGNYDLVVRRPDFDEIAFTVLSSAQGGNRFKGVLDSDSRQTSGIAEMVEAGIETDEVKYVCNIGVLSKENMLTTIYFKISDLLDRVSPNAGTSYGEFTGDGDLASREASGSPWKKISFPEVLPKAGYAFLKWVMQDETDITEDTFGFAVNNFVSIYVF